MYRVISYCCGGSGGSPKRTCSVLCGTGDCMELTESAAEDLGVLCCAGILGGCWFWIDRVCVKTKRVWRSCRRKCRWWDRIYSSAKQVGLSPECIILFSSSSHLRGPTSYWSLSARAPYLVFRLTLQSPRILQSWDVGILIPRERSHS